MKPIINFLIIMAFIFGSTYSLFSQNPEQIYQKGLMKEEGEGNLPDAIDLYMQIADISNANKSIQAKALLHVGLCYEKLGKQEAVKAYQRLVSNFPGQKNEVAVARERLSRLILVTEKVVKSPLIPKFRKIRTPFSIPQWSGSRLSPDGKILAFGSGNDIWTVPIPGKVDPGLVGEPKKLPGAADVLGDGLSWSGDGRRIAFSRAYSRDLRGGATSINFRPEGAHIDVIPSFGGEPKRIPVPQWVTTKGNTHRRLSLSYDGKIVAFDSGGQIYVASVGTGVIRQVTREGGISPCFSPDGMKIAYLTPGTYQDNPPALLNEVWVISADGDDAVKVSGNLNENLSRKGPTWSPDGSMIAFGRINTKGKMSSELCIVHLSDEGRPIAPPVQIKLPLFSTDFMTGWTSDNKIGLLLETPYHEYVYTVSVLGGKANQVSPLDGLASIPNWSPDGKRIYFRWKKGGLGSVPGEGGEVSVHSGLAQIIKETGLFTIYPGAGNSVSPDGKSVVFSAQTAKSKMPNIYTIPVEGGESKQIVSGGGFPCWSPDGKWVAYMALEGKNIVTLFKIPKEGGEAQKITTATDRVTQGGFDWSPDGKTIAFFSKKANTSAGTLNLIPADGGESREVCKVQNIIAHNNVSWSPNGKKIAFVSNGKIWMVQAQGGETVEIKTDVDARAGMLDWSPDGKKIAFSGESGMKPELWFMEDFLPFEKLAQENDAAKVPPKVLTNKKIWDDSDTDLEGAPSPDGRYLSYVDWDTGDLAIYEIATGKKRRLTNKGTWDESDEFAEFSRWSPDSKQIVYDWFNKDDFIEIRTIGLNNSEPLILYKNKDVEWAQTYDWSPDGKYILACFTREKEKQQIVLISVADGSERILKTFDLKWPHCMNFSPDGRYIVYDLPKNKDSEDRDIFIMSVDGGNEIPLVEHPATDMVLGWVPDGKNILFVSDRTGSPDIWGIKIINGKIQGNPKLIQPNKGPFSPTGLGFTKDGSFYYGNRPNRTDVYTSEIDPETGAVIVPPQEAIRHNIESNGTPAYSYDGKYLAYVSRRPSMTMRFTTNPTGNVLCIRSLETGKEKEFRPDINVFGWPQWSPDGSSVIVVNWNTNGDMGYYQIDTQTGNTTPVKLTEGRSLFGGHGWSPDGNSFFYGLRDAKTKKYQIIVRNINSGKENAIYQSEHHYKTSLSPDGKLFALFSYNEQCLKILPVTGGEPRELFVFEELQESESSGVSICWASDGKYIYITRRDSKMDDSKWEICRISVNDGQLEKLGLIMEGVFANLSAHPDGKHITFSSSGKSNSEVWVMENFLIKSKSENK